MPFFLVFFLLFSCCSYSEEVDDAPSLLDQIATPVPKVAGAINLISGNYVDQEAIAYTSGVDPYPLSTQYTSSAKDVEALAYGFSFSYDRQIEAKYDTVLAMREGSKPVLFPHIACREKRWERLPYKPVVALLNGGSGARFVFHGKDDTLVKISLNNAGYMRTASIAHPYAHRIQDASARFAGDRWIVDLGDRIRKTFKRHKKTFGLCYDIVEEKLPSGNYRLYSYDKKNTLTKIETVDSKKEHTINYVTFDWKKKYVRVTTSEDLVTKIFLEKFDKHSQGVSSIKRQGYDPSEYTFHTAKNGKKRLYAKKFPSGLEHKISYYNKGDNTVGGKTVHVSQSSDKKFYADRVKELSVRVSPKGNFETLYTIEYKRWKTDSFRVLAKESDGYMQSVIYDAQYRPKWTTYWDKDENRVRSEYFHWSERGTLKKRIIHGEDARALLDLEYKHDGSGNVIEEIYTGHLTGKYAQEIEHSSNPRFFTETAKKEATYDKRGLQTGFSDFLGNWTYVEHDKERDLIVARFFCEGKKRIIRREFFSYNSAGVLIKSIVDDGSSKEKESMEDVFLRTTTVIRPRKVMPYFGTPEETTIFIWTPEHGEQIYRIEKNLFDTKGRIASAQVLNGKGEVLKTVSFTYDENDRVLETIFPDGSYEIYSYNRAGMVEKKKTPEATFSYTYDYVGRVLEEKKQFHTGSCETKHFEYSLSGRTVTQIDPQGRRTVTKMDNIGRVIESIHPAFSTENGVHEERMVKKYCGHVEIIENSLGRKTKIVRSAFGKPLIVVDALGNKTFFLYDLQGNLLSKKDPSGLETLYTYDAFNRVTSITEKTENETVQTMEKKYRGFQLVSEKFPTKKIQYTYDGLGRKSSQTTYDRISHKKTTENYFYDDLHRCIKTVYSVTGVSEVVEYDLLDRETSRRIFDAEGKLLSVSSSTYDLAGRVVEKGEGRAGTVCVSKTVYGDYGLPSKIIAPDGTTTQFFYEFFLRSDTGGVCSKKKTVDPRGVVTEELFDANNQLREVFLFSPYGDKISHKTIAVNELGKPTRISEDVIHNAVLEGTIHTTFSYDALGQMTSCTFAANSDEQSTYCYAYDQSGKKISETKPSGIVFTSSYDAKGRLSEYKSSDNSVHTQYRYNVQGLATQIINQATGKTTEREYDGLGRILKEKFENGLQIAYQTDVAGRINRITYPDGSTSTYEHTSGMLHKILRNGWEYVVSQRDLSGCITKATLPLQLGTIEQKVDCMGRRVLLSHHSFSEERTAFDPVGNCLERTIGGAHEVFTYDFLCQLTSDDGKESSYDSLCRRKKYENTVSEHNQKHQILSSGAKQYTYDTDGRRVFDGKRRYQYDAADRLVCCEEDAFRVEYTYDSANRRMSMTQYAFQDGGYVQTDREHFFYQNECEIGSCKDNGEIVSLRLLGEGLGAELGAAVAFEVQRKLYVPIHDLSGNVRLSLNEDGSVAEKVSYTAFGPVFASLGISPWTFASKRQDALTGLIFFGERYYDPETVSWITQDPLGFSAGPNLYAYVGNSPLMRHDLFGLFGFGEVGNTIMSCAETIWNGICYGVTSVVDFCFGTSYASEYSSPDPSAVEEAALSRDSFTFPDGVTVTNQDSRRSGLYCYPDRTPEEFIANHINKPPSSVLLHVNGMEVSVVECLYRIKSLVDERITNGEDVSGLLAYNSTNGFFNDFLEAVGSILGVPPSVEEILYGQLTHFLQSCKDSNIAFSTEVIAHSQGVAILGNLYSRMSEEHLDLAEHFFNEGRFINLGGPCLSPYGDNYMTLGDPVVLFGLVNVFELVREIFEHRIHLMLPTKFEFPHNFNGSGYQRVIRRCLRGG